MRPKKINQTESKKYSINLPLDLIVRGKKLAEKDLRSFNSLVVIALQEKINLLEESQ